MSESSVSLKQTIQSEMKTAMKAGNKTELGVIRLIMAAIKQREVDERIELNDDQVIVVLDKMLKQRRESIAQYSEAGRNDLADVEAKEVEIIQKFLPQPLDDAEIEVMIKAAIEQASASSIRDMGKVMGIIKPQMQGRADMAVVSGRIKGLLA